MGVGKIIQVHTLVWPAVQFLNIQKEHATMAHRNWDVNCKIYIGGLRDDANRYDLEDAFTKYGPVRNVWVARRPPGFAFVEMEDPRDAEDETADSAQDLAADLATTEGGGA